MKIAVTAQDEGLHAPVDPRFGRTPWFVVVDLESDRITSIPNTISLNAVQGAGIQAAQLVAEQAVSHVITGHCGPKAYRALNAAGIAVVTEASGTVESVIEAFRAGRLTVASAPNSGAHGEPL